LPPAEALRAAQATMMTGQRWREPYYWSGFVLQGSW
jgi:CHAT domain-containing protein